MSETKIKDKPNAKTDGFSEEEKAAMKARVQELRRSKAVDGETQVREAIDAMQEPSRSMAERLHAIIKANGPELSPKTWYGMPAYANRDGKVVCFFRPAEKFKERYMTVGFNETAKLDDGHMWPIAFALTDLTAAEEAKIGALVKKAVS
jgi:uncharacterized protein YdhG (YjbR/CyaY superfamily)